MSDLVETLIKVAGGFALGFFARALASKHKPVKAHGKSKAAARPVQFVRPKEELKMVLCVNEALKMRAGKIGAQCAHASVGVMQKYRPKNELLFRQWEFCGQPKIALKVQDDNEMDELAAKASAMGIPHYIVCDAGRTQVPAGSQTVLAIGPGPKSEIDLITGHLRLL